MEPGQPFITDEYDPDFVPDAPEDYPALKTYQATLPTGMKCLLQRPQLMALMKRGDIPNPLIDVIQKAILEADLTDKANGLIKRAEQAGRSLEDQATWERENGTDAENLEIAALIEEAEGDDVTTKDATSYIELLVYGAMHTPALSFDPPKVPGGRVTADGKLSIHAIQEEDKIYILRWATKQLDGAATFRGDGASPDPVSGGGEVRDEAEHDAGDDRAGAGVGSSVR